MWCWTPPASMGQMFLPVFQLKPGPYFIILEQYGDKVTAQSYNSNAQVGIKPKIS